MLQQRIGKIFLMKIEQSKNNKLKWNYLVKQSQKDKKIIKIAKMVLLSSKHKKIKNTLLEAIKQNIKREYFQENSMKVGLKENGLIIYRTLKDKNKN